MRPLVIKLSSIGIVCLLLLIPLSLIKNTIHTREYTRQEVISEIAQSTSIDQTITGPLLVLPYVKSVVIKRKNTLNEEYEEATEVKGKLYFLPKNLKLISHLSTSKKYRGIYSANLYRSNNEIFATYELPENYGVTDDFENYQFLSPFITIGVSDSRGIESIPTASIGGDEYKASPGTNISVLKQGFHINLDKILPEKKIDVMIPIVLRGTNQFNVLPIGENNKVVMTSEWLHPHFLGHALPTKTEVTDAGFKAIWETNDFSTNLSQIFEHCSKTTSCDDFFNRSSGVKLIDPVDQYVKTSRSTKYALLFILLTFMCFFLFEVLKQIPIHPIQYGLIGLSLAIFYLLLLSLSEHVSFWVAYSLSALACIAIIGTYVSALLKNLSRTLSFSVALGILYILLYIILSSEDYALLFGSMLMFSLLSTFMILTRKVDWYSMQSLFITPTEEERINKLDSQD